MEGLQLYCGLLVGRGHSHRPLSILRREGLVPLLVSSGRLQSALIQVFWQAEDCLRRQVHLLHPVLDLLPGWSRRHGPR